MMGRGEGDIGLETKRNFSPGVINEISSLALLFDTGGRLVFANQSAEDFFSLSIKGKSLLTIYDLLLRPYSIRDLTEKGRKNGHVQLLKDGGRWRKVSATANVYPGQHLWVLDDTFYGESVPQLSPRETQILRFLALGANNGEIAYAFDIAATTVQQHTSALKKKLGAATRAQVIERAIYHHLLYPQGATEISMMQDVKLEQGKVAKHTIRYLDGNTLNNYPEAKKHKTMDSRDFLDRQSLEGDIAKALVEDRPVFFVDRQVQPFWMKEKILVEGSINPLPEGRCIIHLVF